MLHQKRPDLDCTLLQCLQSSTCLLARHKGRTCRSLAAKLMIQASSQSLMPNNAFLSEGFLNNVALQAAGCGPPEMVSCGTDGCVRVWDVRQEDQPVASFEPQKGSQVQAQHCTCWQLTSNYCDDQPYSHI